MKESMILTYWAKSLEPFKKANLKLYLLGSLVTFIRSISILAKQFWILWIAKWATNLLILHSLSSKMQELLLIGLINILSFYVAVMTVRSSVEIKNYHYYLKYISGILLLLALYLSHFSFFVVLAFMLFFFLDSDQSFFGFAQSVMQTIKAIIFFAPACILFTILSLATYTSGSSLLSLSKNISLPWLQNILFICCFFVYDFLFLFILSSFSVYYTKLKHEHFDFLFPQ